MYKRLNRPEQLRLELGWDYLKRVVAASESFDLYEVTARTLFAGQSKDDANPVFEKCFNYQN